MSEHTFTEAPASATMRVDIKGYDVLFTLRAETGAELLGKVDAAIEYFQKMNYQPAGARSSNGHTSNGSAPPCPDGHGPMKESTKRPGTYYCPHVIAESGGKKIYCQCKA